MNIGVKMSDEYLQKAVDEVSTTLSYVGQTKVGNATSTSTWQILKIEKIGNVTTTSYPVLDGVPTSEFKFVWDNRASLTYSLS